MNKAWWSELSENILAGNVPAKADCLRIADFDWPEVLDLISLSNRVRISHKGKGVGLCAIVNAKSGKCTEDCAFCAQSAHYKTTAPTYDLLPREKIEGAASRAKEAGVGCFSVVVSGYGLEGGDSEAVARSVSSIAEMGMRTCVSGGNVDAGVLSGLKKAGLKRFHHNLETAESYFDKICTTHTYKEDVETLRLAKSLGLEICCGGIFGMGESFEQRIELLHALAEFQPESVPLNFLSPIPGTPLENKNELTPVDCLKITALARLILQKSDIVLCGGREKNFRDFQALALFAGANVIMTGDYLTTPGRHPELDRKMIEDAGFVLEGNLVDTFA